MATRLKRLIQIAVTGSQIAFAALILSACAHNIITVDAPIDPCKGMDWWEQGRADGVRGNAAAKVEEHRALCATSQFKPNEEFYANGRDAGLVDYCTPIQGLEAGRAGNRYKGVCPAQFAEGFLDGYEKGHRIFELRQENEALEMRIRNGDQTQAPRLKMLHTANESEIIKLESVD